MAVQTSEESGLKLDQEALLLLAEAYDNLNRSEDAIEAFRFVISKNPRNAIAHAGLGMILLGTGSRNYASVNACGLVSYPGSTSTPELSQLNQDFPP